MKKSTLIVIALIYVASIVIISVFGLRAMVFDEVIPVTKIECLNETDEKTTVKVDSKGKKLITIDYTEPGDEVTLTGTMVQLSWRVLPDNATTKDVRFVYNTELTRVKFVKNDEGKELGLILFTGKVKLDVQIVSTDGTRVYQDVTIWVK